MQWYWDYFNCIVYLVRLVMNASACLSTTCTEKDKEQSKNAKNT